MLHFGENSVMDYLVWTILSFRKKINSDCQYVAMRSWKMMLNPIWTTYLHLVVYLILTSCFLFGFASWLLRTIISFYENWEIDYLVWTMLSFQIKLKHAIVVFMKLVVHGNMFQQGRKKCCMVCSIRSLNLLHDVSLK